MPGRKQRAGYSTVTPRIVSDEAAGVAQFLQEVFEANGDLTSGRPIELRIGDSLVMVSETSEREPFPAFLYVYVENVDETYERALRARRHHHRATS